MPRQIDLRGKRFGRLIVISLVGKKHYPLCTKSVWLCHCDCGRLTTKEGQMLRVGHVNSCGCLKPLVLSNEKGGFVHGMSHTRTWKSWQSMRKRCEYDLRYVQQGIKVCQEWLESFERFFADMGVRPLGATLDRIDGRQGYHPKNCRWATYKEQRANRVDHGPN